MMSDSSESDISSSYSSDGEVLTVFKRTSDSPPSSDDSDPSLQRTGSLPAFPVDSVSADERTRILNVVSGLDQNNFQIFPSAAREHLTQRHAHIVDRLRELPGREKSVVIASGSLLSLIEGTDSEKLVPKPVLCDVCVFSVNEPVLVLTITSGGGKRDRLTRYNSMLTRLINQSVTSRTRHSFSAVYGVVEESMCRTRDFFISKILRLQRDGRVMSLHQDLVMNKEKCQDVVKSFLLLLPDALTPAPPPQASAKESETCEETFSKQNYAALIKRIEQLELAHSVSEKEKRKLTEKCDKLQEEVNTIKQDYLTDTRLSLLMRPRSSSVSESTVSGYGSTIVAGDISDRQEAESSHTEALHGAGIDQTDKNETQQHPELSTESIHTGNIELVQYNRDITLHQACEEGKQGVVKYILSQGVADINCRGKSGRTPVMAAANKGHVTVFDFLVSLRCDLSAVDNNKDNVLHIACMGGSTDIVRKLVDSETCDIESRGRYGRTPVMKAVYFGHRGVVDLLKGAGCQLAALDDERDTVLHVACLGGNVDMVKYILSLDIVSIESRGYHGRTPVMTAAALGHRGAFDLLVSAGSSLTTTSDDRDTVLHMACLGGHVDMVKYILSLDIVGIESRGQYGRTPVMHAAEKGHRGVFDLLVSAGSSLTTTSDDRDTVLHMACLGGHVDMVKYILSLDIVGIESRGQYGLTPVMHAAVKGHRGVFDLLVSAGSSLTTTSDDRDTVLHVACLGGHVDMVKYILSLDIVGIESRGQYGLTPVMHAAEKGHRGVFDLLVSAGSSLTTTSDDRDTVLHVACLGGHVDMVKYILSLDIVSIESRGQYGRTPVMTAAAMGHRGVFDLLVSAGSSLTTTDDDRSTLFHVACIGGDVGVVKHLLTLGVVGEKEKDKDGDTPVQIAESKGHTVVVSLLKARK